MSETFQVDLRGLVDLLSRHLYSGPRVFIREILQNGVDAVTARRLIEPEAPASMVIEAPSVTGDGSLRCSDTGIGLDLDDARNLLSTIGASSKRDELGMARRDFIGQFGIGLLSCFLVSDQIVVRSRKAGGDGSTILWRGNSDGTYTVGLAGEPLDAPGTELTLVPRPGERWFDDAMIAQLISDFGAYLPVPVTFVSASGRQVLTAQTPPWRMSTPESIAWAERNLGFRPIAVIALDVPIAGLKGVAYVLREPAHPSQRIGHQMWLHSMLLGRRVEKLAPDWAYFVRVVADAEHLRPTASREDLFDDDLLAETRDAIGAAIIDYIAMLARKSADAAAEIVSIHARGLQELALHNRTIRDLVVAFVPVETSLGPGVIADMLAERVPIRYTRTVDQFRSLADVARAQDMLLINGGYTYIEEILSRVALDRGAADIALVDPDALLNQVSLCTPDELQQASRLLTIADDVLSELGVQVEMRRFEPVTMPAIYLPDPDLAVRMVAGQAREVADGIWGEILGVVNPFSDTAVPRLVLNRNHELIVRLIAVQRRALVAEAIRALHVQCLLAGRHALGSKERGWAQESLFALLDAALPD